VYIEFLQEFIKQWSISASDDPAHSLRPPETHQ